MEKQYTSFHVCQQCPMLQDTIEKLKNHTKLLAVNHMITYLSLIYLPFVEDLMQDVLWKKVKDLLHMTEWVLKRWTLGVACVLNLYLKIIMILLPNYSTGKAVKIFVQIQWGENRPHQLTERAWRNINHLYQAWKPLASWWRASRKKQSRDNVKKGTFYCLMNETCTSK